MKKVTYTGQLSTSEIEALKQKHGELSAVIADNYIAYFRPVKRSDVNFATSQIDKDTAMDFNMYVMKECFVGGAIEVLEIDRLYLSAQRVFKDMIEGAKVELVKL